MISIDICNAKSIERKSGLVFVGHDFIDASDFPNTEPWFNGIDLKGKEVKVLNRLMSGHDFSKSWLARMKLVSDPDCELCDTPETAEHLILRCPKYGILRMKYTFNNKYRMLMDLLKTKNVELFREVTDFLNTAKITL